MRICPKCGYHDIDQFRPRSNRPYCEYSKIDNLIYSYPKLVEKIKDNYPKFTYDGHFLYKINKKFTTVERIELEYYKIMGWGQELQEKQYKIDNVKQLKLSDIK